MLFPDQKQILSGCSHNSIPSVHLPVVFRTGSIPVLSHIPADFCSFCRLIPPARQKTKKVFHHRRDILAETTDAKIFLSSISIWLLYEKCLPAILWYHTFAMDSTGFFLKISKSTGEILRIFLEQSGQVHFNSLNPSTLRNLATFLRRAQLRSNIFLLCECAYIIILSYRNTLSCISVTVYFCKTK